MEVFCKLTVLHLPGSLKLDKLPGATFFAEHIKLLPGKLVNEERGQNFQKFPCRTHQYLPRGLKRGKESKIFKKSLAKHIKILPGSLKSRKSGQFFSKIFL